MPRKSSLQQLRLPKFLGYKFIETERTELSEQIGAGVRELRKQTLAEAQRDTIFSGNVPFESTLNFIYLFFINN